MIRAISLVLAMLGLASMSCSGGLCPTVVRTAVTAQTKVSEGFRGLEQVRQIMSGVPMPDETHRQLTRAITDATEVLSEINAILAASIPACNEPNLDDKFKAFNAAWFAIKNILNMFSENAGYWHYVGKGDVGFSAPPVLVSGRVQDPFFYVKP